MIPFNSWKTLALAAGLAVTSVGCGDVVRTGRSPVFLVINALQAQRGTSSPKEFGGTLLSDVITSVTSPAPCTPTAPCVTTFDDMGKVFLTIAVKDISMAPTSNNRVTVTRYRVDYRRADGRNTPGVDVPYGFDGAVTGTVVPAGETELGFEIVRHVAKHESPLVELGHNPNIISTIADVTFFGRDLVGNEVAVTGSILIEFGNFGDF